MGYGCPDVDVLAGCLDGYDQGVADSAIAAVTISSVLPPAGDGIHGHYAAAREVGCGSLPDIRMKRP